MSYETSKMVKLAALVAMAVVLMPAMAFAQRSSGGVTGGARQHPGTWGNQRASRSIGHARDYARDIYSYSRDAGSVDPAVAKEESEELGHNIDKAQKDLAAARKEVGNDAQALATLKSVQQHLAAAAAQHKMLHEECCKDSVDGDVCMQRCSQILLELDKAQAEQDALIRSMEIKGAPPSSASSMHHHQ